MASLLRFLLLAGPLLFPLLASITPACASEPFLVADLETAGIGSAPAGFLSLDGLVYFTADDTLHGRELWVSDGTEAGTRRLTDLRPGGADSLSPELVRFAGRLFFRATDGNDGGWGVWTSDGTEQGTVRFAGPEETGSQVQSLVVAGDRLFWSAAREGERTLWVTDGQPGTIFPFDQEAVGDLTATGLPTAAGPLLYFTARREGGGRTLWRTDGTPQGTFPLPQVVDPVELAALPDGRLLVAVETRPSTETWQLWVSDGSETGTRAIFERTSSGGPFVDLLADAAGRFFFTLSDGFGGFELWMTDGTADGTRFVDELQTEEPEEVPRLPSFAPFGGRLVFSSFEPATGRELWVSDGTAAGTSVLADLVPGPEGSQPLRLTPADGRLFWSARTPEHGRELWRIDLPAPSETASPVRLTDAAAGPEDSDPGALRFVDGRLWLALTDGRSGHEPWSSDGSPEGTRRVATLGGVATASSSPVPVGSLGRLLFFALEGDPEGLLWRSDGSPEGTFPLAGTAGPPGRFAAVLRQAFEHRDRLYFVGAPPDAPGSGLVELWRTDGEVAEPVTDLRAVDLTAAGFGDRILLSAATGGELGLYRLGEGRQAERLATLRPSADFAAPRILAGTERAFVLAPGEGAVTTDLWITDGERAELVVGGLGPQAHLREALVQGNRLFFVNATPEEGEELWTSDGTAAGTRFATDLAPGVLSGNPHDLALLDGWLYFLASTAGERFDDNGNLWRIDAAATRVENLHSQCIARLVAASWRLYFVPCSTRNGLWTVSGEPPSVRRVAVVRPDFPLPFPLPALGPLTPSGGLVYFPVEDVEHPQSLAQIWVSDGTEEGTRIFTDLTFGDVVTTPPRWIRTAGGLVFFDADDRLRGRELWAAPAECFTTGGTLCLGDERFQTRARWRDFGGKAGGATTVPFANESGGFWFFDERNPELLLKSLDGRPVNDRFWVFSGSLSNVGFDLEVLDTRTGSRRLYRNSEGRFASFGDTVAFDGESTMTSVVEPPAGRPPEVVRSSGAIALCIPGSEAQCQLDRFRVEVLWRDFDGRTGFGRVRTLSDGVDGFWFFDPDNVELVVKVLDGRPVNGRYWVFFGALTNVQFDLVVTDTETGIRRRYLNPEGSFASFGDVEGFLP